MPSHFTVKNYFDRTRELEVLRNIPSEAASGNASGIFLSGRNGIGKTELLRQAYHAYFHEQGSAIPFFYTIKTALTSIENFSKDYFSSFIIQSLAFLKKDRALAEACVYSYDDILRISRDADVKWIADVTEKFEQARKEGDRLGLFRSAISAPYQVFLMSGQPVIVMLDDFHKMRKFCEMNAVDHYRDFWVLFETTAVSRHTPHIFSGNQAELNRMFFEDTLFGEHLELFNLSGLANDDAVKYFSALSATYGLQIRIDLYGYIELFGGSLYYIRNFVQSARQSTATLSQDNFWLIYLSEITKGKTFRYWTSILKTSIQHLDEKKLALRYLYQLCRERCPIALQELPEETTVSEGEKERIVDLLQVSGVVEVGFSKLDIADDRVLIDIVKGLYLREIGAQPWSVIKEAIIGRMPEQVTTAPESIPVFTLSMPATTTAELAAVKSIEHIARNFNVPTVMIGQIQIAIADIFANVIRPSETVIGSYILRCYMKDMLFSAEITIPVSQIALTDADRSRIGMHLDGLSVESSGGTTRVTLLKDISRDLATAT